MSTVFADLVKRIATEFPAARREDFKGHELARLIRNAWKNVAKDLVLATHRDAFKFDSSAGVSQWNSAPWLAVLHPGITTSAQAGYYPVYLFEPEFQTICLVMGQGAEKLEQAVGKKRALVELKDRADKLRDASDAWKTAGFFAGPFHTTRDNAAKRASKGDSEIDPWAVSVAFGKRYEISALPSDAKFGDDLDRMLEIYNNLVTKRIYDLTIDQTLAEMAATGELPTAEAGIDGVKRVAYHKRFEYRHRNKKLIDQVKKKLGYACQACGFRFDHMYGPRMGSFIEAHHKTPISELPEDGAKLKPDAENFMVLCSNCHRAIHAAGCPDLDTFKAGIAGQISGFRKLPG
jgi:5-methylcytosine-specific restriction protein A